MSGNAQSHPGPQPDRPGATQPAPEAAAPGLPFDPLRLVDVLWRRWHLPLLAALVGAIVGGSAGFLRFRTNYTATGTIIRREVPNTFRASETGEAFKPRQLSLPTMVSLMRSSSILQQVADNAKPRVTASFLSRSLTVTPERNTDLIRVGISTAASAETTLALLTGYLDAVVRLSKDLQAQEASEINAFLKNQLATTDRELNELQRQTLDYSREAQLINADKETDAYLRELGDYNLRYETTRIELETIDLRIRALERELSQQNPAHQKVAAAQEDLDRLLTQYTDANPLVLEAKERLARMQAQESQSTTNPPTAFQMTGTTVGNAVYLDLVAAKAQKESLAQQLVKLEEVRAATRKKLSALPEKALQLAQFKLRQQALETMRTLLASRQREAQLFEDNALGYFRLFSAPGLNDVEVASRTRKLSIVAAAGGAVFGGLTLVLLLLVELLNDTVKTRADVARVTRLPVLGTLGALDHIPADQLKTWAFRLWTLIASRMPSIPGRPITLGFTAARAGEGVSTWVRLLAEAASQRGLRVLAITNAWPSLRPQGASTPADTSRETGSLTLEGALEDPKRVKPQLEAAGALVALRVKPDWRWSPAACESLDRLASVLGGIPGTVLLVEMPVAGEPAAVLLADKLQTALWVSRSGTASSSETTAQLATLQHSGCRLAGAVLNAQPSRPWTKPLTTAAGMITAGILFLSAALPMFAAQHDSPAQPEPAANNEDGPAKGTAIGSSASSTAGARRLAPWQERLTLGPGDVLTFTLYSRPDLTRSDVSIGPDGKVSYLRAQGIQAAGLTIDELREALDAKLNEEYRYARTIITPVAFRSKKYYLLGKVVDNGVFTLERPLTIIEAVARARGLETGLFEQNTVELADLPRSFIVRGGTRLPVDFEKLFQQGDLSQNIQLEPGDYLYFPSANANELYILGAVASPGLQGFTPNASVISAIAIRGGFTPQAYRQRVLVVRGSLSKPESFVVNTAAILAGKQKDFPLQPKDLVYVADRPWKKVEELLDMAAMAFTQAAVATWTGQNIGPMILRPVIPSIK